MPYCTRCGTQVGPEAAFCPECGMPQRPTASSFDNFASGLSDRTVAILCYLPMCGFIPAIIVLLSHRYRSNIRMRFDAFQSLYLFLAGLVLDSIGPTMMFAGWPGGGPAHVLGHLLKLVLVGAWIYLLVKATQGQQVRLPIIGDLAARSTYEQL